MATFNSAGVGNWDTDATWTEVGHPASNDDVVIIAHAVTYDAGDSAITWGDITLNSGGVLIMPTGADSTVNFNTTGKLTINNGSELRIGVSGTPIGAAYHCYFYWPQGTATKEVLELNNGGIINIYGDPTFYGSTKHANLDADWITGQTFYITGDYSAKWQSGQKFYIHENKKYSNYQSDGHIYIINTIGAYDAGNDRTPITIVEAAPGLTFTAIDPASSYQSKLINVSRNVVLGDPACPLTVFGYDTYSERLVFDNNQATANSNIHFNDVMMYGWDKVVDGGYNFIAENIVFISNHYVFYYGTSHQVNGDFISNYIGINSGTNIQVTGDFVSNHNGINSGTNHQGTGDFVSNSVGVNYGTNHREIGNFISNHYGVNFGTIQQVIGDFIFNHVAVNYGVSHQILGDFISNDYGIAYGMKHQVTGDFVNNATSNVSLNNAEVKYSTVLDQCVIATVQRPLRVYGNTGNFLPLVSGDAGWQTPPSTLSWELQVTPNSYCNTNFCSGQMELSPLRDMAAYVTAGSKTLTFKIYPVGWTTALDQDDILIQARYLSGASGNDRIIVETGIGTFANGAWRDLTVTFTAGQAGLVYFNLFIRKYESACYILIDPQWVIS